jgi:catechol 2,3-dioxygenase-like lactoylglutathione lyase family enzyme
VSEYSHLVLAGIDHVILAVADPDGAAAEMERVLGLRASAGGRHDAHGTHNRLIFLGDAYLELMGVFDAGLADRSWWGAHAKQLLSREPAAYAGLPLASDDLDADIARLRALGSPISEPIAGERRRPDGELVRWRVARLLEPDPDLGLSFLIEHDAGAAEWRPADRAARAAEVHPLGTPARLVRVELPVSDVRAATLRLLRQLGLQFRPSLAGRGGRDAAIGLHTLRVSTAAARPRITLRAGTKPREILDLLGCDWELLAY